MKIRKLLETITPVAYVPVDISKDHLVENARELHGDFPDLHVYPVCADITLPLDLPPEVAALKKLAFFPGSSIGNFNPEAAVEFLSNVHATVGPGGDMLIGVDRKKDEALLRAAYNDAKGVTAAFNLNILEVINRELGAQFNLDLFEHHAFFNGSASRIEMHLRSKSDQMVYIRDLDMHVSFNGSCCVVDGLLVLKQL